MRTRSRRRKMRMPPRQSTASQQDILVAASRLFADHGFDGVSLSAIARLAGTSKANILYHFSSKDTLYIRVLEDSCIEVMDALEMELNATSDIQQRLARFAERHLQGLLERADIGRLIMRELQDRDNPRGRELANGVLRNHFNAIVGHIESAQAQGTIRANIDPAVLIATILGADSFFFGNREHLRDNEKCQGFVDEPGRFTCGMVDILLNGILVPEPTPDPK